MSEHPIQGLISTALEKIREMVDVNTIIGDPVTTDDGTTIIPVSKVSFGFASGGSDLPSKLSSTKEMFGGGSGAGISITPIAFIVVNKGEVKLLQLSMNSNSSNAVINMIPDVVDKISSLIKGKDDKKNKDKDKDNDQMES